MIEPQSFSVASHRGTYAVHRTSLRTALSAGLQPDDRLIIDETVLRLHPFVRYLSRGSQTHAVRADESLKALDGIRPLLSWLIETGFNRSGTLYVIGGGTVQDAASFAASILHRGVRWVFVPTTLLAQGDSCIGSKSSINFDGFKNQLGTFYPPAEVIIDEEFLHSLAPAEVRSGIGEILHYAVLGGASVFGAYEEALATGWDKLSPGQMSTQAMNAMVVKRSFIEADEFDADVRKNLNLGHTFGHGLEFASGGRIPHGVAVAYGTDMAASFSAKLGIAQTDAVERVWQAVRRIVGGLELSSMAPDRVLEGMAKDKKRCQEGVELVLIEDLGRPVRVTVPVDEHLGLFIASYLRSW